MKKIILSLFVLLSLSTFTQGKYRIEIEPSAKIFQNVIQSYNSQIEKEVSKIYSKEEISERHKHKYCILDEKIAQLALNNLVVLGKSQDKKIVEIIENKNNDFYIGVQFRPEYNSKPLDSNPIFIKFIEECINKKTKKQK